MVRYAGEDPYVAYYLNQARTRQQYGGELAAFAGARFQRGHGLGNLFKRFKAALPTFFKTLGRHALRSAVNVGSDYLMGRNFRDSLGPRVMEGVKGAASDVGPALFEGIKSGAREIIPQFGTGKRKRTKRKSKAKRRRIDIFA